MEARGYIFTRRSDHYEYVRPNKTDNGFSVSGTLGRRNSNGKYYLKNFSTSDPYFSSEEAVSLSEAPACWMAQPAGYARQVADLGYGEPLALETDGDPVLTICWESQEPVETDGASLISPLPLKSGSSGAFR